MTFDGSMVDLRGGGRRSGHPWIDLVQSADRESVQMGRACCETGIRTTSGEMSVVEVATSGRQMELVAPEQTLSSVGNGRSQTRLETWEKGKLWRRLSMNGNWA